MMQDEATTTSNGSNSEMNQHQQHQQQHQQQHLPGNAAMREFMDRLSCVTNVSKYIELPQIVVMGDTSSGKSSLLSNLVMVDLPSSHKLTTRCPIQLQMMRSDTRRARVNVQWRSSNNNSKSSNNNNISDTLPDFGERMIHPDQWDTIPDVILEAQQHILTRTNKEVAPDVLRVYRIHNTRWVVVQ
jgi:septin family protein